MSIKTTHLVTRDFAIQAILRKLYDLSDAQLADMLETTLHNGFYNFSIVSDQELEDNFEKEYPTPALTDLNNLPEENDAW